MVVIIVAYNRPQFLQLCLERIQLSEGAENNQYIFALDYGYDPAIRSVINSFPFNHMIIETPNKGYTIGKQSFNVLNSWLVATQYGELCCMIEDDVMIGTDFFKWHETVHKLNPDLFAAVGTKNHNTRVTVNNDLNAYYVTRNMDYQSLGVSIRSDVINQYIKPHFNKSYFIDPVNYCTRVFPPSEIGSAFAEQDGLIRRIKSGLPVAFPCVPRAFHSGFYGKNRGTKRKFTVEQLRTIIFDPVAMRNHCGKPEYFYDSEPVNLNTNFDELYELAL